jgi:nicotinamide mononucleotide transporter PnuC
VLGTIVGVTALIFMARGDVWGQILTIAFSILYGVTAWHFRYWGEMITYLGMSLPMAALATIAWLRNPYQEGEPEVAIHRLSRAEWFWGCVLAIATTALFGWLLHLLDTPNLVWSTLSVTTSFFAAYLTWRRASWYAVAYALNDVVLIVLWILAALEDIAYAPMIACFAMFLLNDLYAFVCWKQREKQQGVA